MIPPGLNKVIFVKFTSFIINKDSMKEIPVSEAPTTTILVLFYIFKEFKCFFVIIEREKGAYSSSKAFLSISMPPLFTSCL
jgi:hypothetical protein